MKDLQNDTEVFQKEIQKFLNLNSELGHELKEIEKKIPSHNVIKAESIQSVKGILGELKKFKKNLEFNNLRMVTIKERIGEISQAVERVEAIVEIVKEDSKVLSEDPIENLVLQFNQKSETKLTKVSDALYKVFDKTVTVRINPENEFEA